MRFTSASLSRRAPVHARASAARRVRSPSHRARRPFTSPAHWAWATWLRASNASTRSWTCVLCHAPATLQRSCRWHTLRRRHSGAPCSSSAARQVPCPSSGKARECTTRRCWPTRTACVTLRSPRQTPPRVHPNKRCSSSCGSCCIRCLCLATSRSRSSRALFLVRCRRSQHACTPRPLVRVPC